MIYPPSRKIIASNNVNFYKELFFPLRCEALKRVSTEIWSFFLWVTQTSNIFHINRKKKNNCRNVKVAPKAKFKTGIGTSEKNQEKQNCHLIRLYKCLCCEYILSRNTISVSRAYCRLVLVSARTGLIFTRSQEGTQLHWADPTWPNRTGYSIPCAVMLCSGWGGAGRREVSHGSEARVRGSGRWEWLCAFCCVVYSPYLYCCCYCSICLLFS